MAFKIPKNQIHWESIYDSKRELKQIITSDQHKEKWFLYDVDGDALTKIEIGDSPKFKKRINKTK